jgi:hypothetical protein
MRVPKGLGVEGKRLWKAITSEFECEEQELIALEQCCRALDLAARLAAELDAEKSLTVTGSRGQTRPHPLIASTQSAWLTFGRLYASLRLPESTNANVRLPQVRGSNRGFYGPRGVVA